MHRFDTSVPHFFSQVRGTRIVVTPNIVSKVLHIPRIAYLDYPSCDCLRTVSKDELLFLFCETTLSWGDRQNTPCLDFAKGLRFLNMVMTFILHSLSHYNSITEPHAQFLLSLLEFISIDLPSHFILSLIDVYRDTMTCDKLIFPSIIMQILRHFFVSFLESSYFMVISVIDVATVRWREAQLRPRRLKIEMVTPLASISPSTSTPSSPASRVTLKAIMGGFTASSFPSPLTLEDESDDGSSSDDADEDDDDDEMTA